MFISESEDGESRGGDRWEAVRSVSPAALAFLEILCSFFHLCLQTATPDLTLVSRFLVDLAATHPVLVHL